MSGNAWTHFDGMVWNVPCAESGNLEWRLRYAAPSKSDLLWAASIIASYQELVNCPRRKREYVVKHIREHAARATYTVRKP